MSKVTCFFITMLLFGRSWGLAQNCALSGTPAWSSVLRNVVGECDNKFLSPDERYVLEIGTDGGLRLLSKPDMHELALRAHAVEPPAMISWSPRSNSFFVNDGGGSGMSSTFRLFRLNGDTVLEDDSIERTAVAYYRRHTHCSSQSADPNVWGFGWSSGGREVFLLVQATANEPCGEPESFLCLVVDTADGSIRKVLTKAEARLRFQSLLPQALFGR